MSAGDELARAMRERRGQRGAARYEGRNGQVWRLYTVYRQNQEQIADDLGISQQRVSEIIREVRANIPAPDLDEMRQQSLGLYAELTERALEIADLAAAPVAVGKDGSIFYDENGEVVRDYTGKLRAIETAAKMDAETRKLMGLDAAGKLEIQGSVRYELVGIDPEDLS